MAEQLTSSKSKAKAKWGKLVSRDKSGAGNKFKLNEDVVDFLKPSTDKYTTEEGMRQQSSAPRIDVAIAQRWPNAAEVRRAAAEGKILSPSIFGRPKRKKNLTVHFAKTAPEIIGEGGDETETPAIEVSKRKLKHQRSFSDRQPPTLDTAAADRHRHAKDNALSAPPMGDSMDQANIQRSRTTAGDSTYLARHMEAQRRPPVRHVHEEPATIPMPELSRIPEPRPGMLRRAPTGFSDDREIEDLSPTSPDEPVPVPELPQIHKLTFENDPTDLLPSGRTSRSSVYSGDDVSGRLSSREGSPPPPPQQFVSKAKNRLRAEARTFRRVSQANYDEDDIADLQSLSSVESPQRTSNAHQWPPMHLSPELQRTGSQPSQVSVMVSPQDERADSMLPGAPPAGDSLSDPALAQGDVNMYKPVQPARLSIPNATAPELHLHQPSSALAPIDYANQQGRARSNSAAKSPSSSVPETPSSMLLPSPNYSRSGHLGVVPGPGHASGGGYFSGGASQTSSSHSASPSLSPNFSQPPSRNLSQNSQYKPFSPMDGQVASAEFTAYADFDARVAHMRGVFRLTAEREQPVSTLTPQQWVRTAIWWLHKGRAGLGQMVRNAPRDADGQPREILTQAHVDVAKTWWILADMLESVHGGTPSDPSSPQQHADVIRSHLRSLILSMQRNGVMPPHQSLIQGQDTTIWIQYPRFAPDAISILRGTSSLLADEAQHETNPLEALPANDTRETFFYTRMFVSASINTEEAETDRAVLPCILSLMRGRKDWKPKIFISSQSDLVNICVKPGDGGHGKGPTWHDVSWKARSHGIYVRLPRGFSLSIDLQEKDFRTLWAMVDYTSKTEAILFPQADEKLVHEARLLESQYSDSSNPHAFPKERVRSCSAFLYEKNLVRNEGTGKRRLRRGYRLVLVTNPSNKTLSSVQHELCRGSPLFFEQSGNVQANEAPTMTIRVQEPKRSCKALLVFGRPSDRQHFYEVINSITLGPDEAVTGHVSLKSLSIEPAGAEIIPPGGGALQSLRWLSARVINRPAPDGSDQGGTVLSQNLRVIAENESGCVADHINLGKSFFLWMERYGCSNFGFP